MLVTFEKTGFKVEHQDQLLVNVFMPVCDSMGVVAFGIIHDDLLIVVKNQDQDSLALRASELKKAVEQLFGPKPDIIQAELHRLYVQSIVITDQDATIKGEQDVASIRVTQHPTLFIENPNTRILIPNVIDINAGLLKGYLEDLSHDES